MKKQLKYIILLLAAVAVLPSCDDPLGADDYIKNPVFRDSIPEIDKTFITYNFVKTIHDTIRHTDTVTIEIPDTSGGAYPSEGFIHKGYGVRETYILNSNPPEEIRNYWNSDPNAFSEKIKLNYRNGKPEISMELEVERSSSIFDIEEDYINKFKFSFEDISLENSIQYLNSQSGLKSEMELLYDKGKYKHTIEGYDSPLELFFIVQYHPDNQNIPLAMEIHLSADLTSYAKKSYSEYSFVAQFLVLFH